MNKYFHRDAPIYFVNFIDGDCVNEHDGRLDGDALTVPVTVKAAEGKDIFINGKRATYSDGLYSAEVSLCGYRNTVVATDGECEAVIALYRLPKVMKKYRLSSDDNIIFLWDINKNRDIYKSIFENPYLAMYKRAHDLYGAKVHINLFYEFIPAESGFPSEREAFDLSQMTDKFRDEFRANSDWLKLAFHASKERPDKPYRHASGDQITEDCKKIHREIVRFAGEECISDSTTVHWGETSIEALRALRTLGFRSLTGYFERDRNGAPVVAYHTDGELCDHIGERDFWYDRYEDMLFGRIDLVLNLRTLDRIKEKMDEIIAHPSRGGFVSIMIHEQYFYEDYCGYLPDFEERVFTACEMLCRAGYIGSHIHEATAEPPLNERI